jgi:hypothetical protein
MFMTYPAIFYTISPSLPGKPTAKTPRPPRLKQSRLGDLGVLAVNFRLNLFPKVVTVPKKERRSKTAAT